MISSGAARCSGIGSARTSIGGEEKDVDVAAKAAERAINSITGREMKGSGG